MISDCLVGYSCLMVILILLLIVGMLLFNVVCWIFFNFVSEYGFGFVFIVIGVVGDFGVVV